MSQMVQEQLHPARVCGCVRRCGVEVAGKDPAFLRDPMPQFSIPLYSRSRRGGKYVVKSAEDGGCGKLAAAESTGCQKSASLALQYYKSVNYVGM